MIVDSDHNDFIMVCKRTVVSPFSTADSYDVILVVQKQGPVVEESHQEGPPSYDDATENGPCCEDFFHFVELCSPFISFFPRGCWETETRRVKGSTDAYTASLTGNSVSYGLQLYIFGTIAHNPAIIHPYSYGLQLYKPSVWRASCLFATPEPPWDDLSPIWITYSPYSIWFTRWASIPQTVRIYLLFSVLGILAAVFWFPFGVGLCLLDRKVRCHRCGLIIEDGICS